MNGDAPIDFSICLKCGASYPLAQERCWVCGNDVVPAGPEPLRHPAPELEKHVQSPVEPVKPQAIPTGNFTLSSMFLMTTLVAVLAAILAQAPGLGIILAIFAVPALLRTISSTARTKEAGVRPDAIYISSVYL